LLHIWGICLIEAFYALLAFKLNLKVMFWCASDKI